MDVGGTFTDCIGLDPEGVLHTCKILSSGHFHGSGHVHAEGNGLRHSRSGSEPQGFFAGFSCQIRLVSSGQTAPLTPIPVLDSGPEGLVFGEKVPEICRGREVAYTLYHHLPAPVLGAYLLTGTPCTTTPPSMEFRLGTTRGTNALLERKGGKTGLLTTHGFEDAFRIAYQNRPDLFSLQIQQPDQIYVQVGGIGGRLSSEGQELEKPRESECKELLENWLRQGIESIAVVLLHAGTNPAHELVVGAWAREVGIRHVVLSHQVSPLPKLIYRGETTLVDAYLAPVLEDYLQEIRKGLPAATVRCMTSAGNLVEAGRFSGHQSILSGPAGGVLGAIHVGQLAGSSRLLGFDMGGTSTDVCRYDGSLSLRHEMELRDSASNTWLRLHAPMLEIETVAAGGGSICWFDGDKPRVGPHSAGASPGPACYGQEGPLTITDMNLFLGHLVGDRFPFQLDQKAVERKLVEMIETIRLATGKSYEPEELAQGFLDIANTMMADAIRRISVAQGQDPRDYDLVSFGGAGSQHACGIAKLLGIRRILCGAHGGILSALGMDLARRSWSREANLGLSHEEFLAEEAAILKRLRQEIRQEAAFDGVSQPDSLEETRQLEIRLRGQDHCLSIPREDGLHVEEAFQKRHQEIFGFSLPDIPIDIHSIRVEWKEAATNAPVPRPSLKQGGDLNSSRKKSQVYGPQGWEKAPKHLKEDLLQDHPLEGPALILESAATIWVEPGWLASVTETGDVQLLRTQEFDLKSPRAHSFVTEADPVELELFYRHFGALAREMGEMLRRTALSTNVKERLDYSCAIFDAQGDLVVNAPHVPVHLGAMSDCVRHLIHTRLPLEPGDSYLTNNPFSGGSHLPDVTVVTPVFVGNHVDKPVFFVANRAHHSEIGGKTPGSMPPFSSNLGEEGVLLPWFRLVHRGRMDEKGLWARLVEAPYPSRSPEQNVADIRAQLASNQFGIRLLEELVQKEGVDKVTAYMGHLRQLTARKVRTALEALPFKESSFEDAMDNGSVIRCLLKLESEPETRLVVDFSGTDPSVPGNLNANPSIVASALIYCLRCLLHEDLPLNAGVLDTVHLVLPYGSMLKPEPGNTPESTPAVVGGNVEVSQRIVDVLLGALGVAAASQGTMNNLLFGRPNADEFGAAFGYYETLAGGAGATPGCPGASAVHTHMTNTRLTDPEILEARYPVRLWSTRIRKHSGGTGEYPGGDGMEREIEFLAPLEVSLLTSRRLSTPYGMRGGAPGEAGLNLWRGAGDKDWKTLPSSAQVPAKPGDRLCVKTPGGGGWGNPKVEN